MRTETRIPCQADQIADAVRFLRAAMERKKVDRKEIARALLTAEEVLTAMIAHAGEPEEKIRISLESVAGDLRIRITCRGTPFTKADVEKPLRFTDDTEANIAIERITSRILGSSLTIRSWHGGLNLAVIRLPASRYRQLYHTIGALVAGLLVGLLLRQAAPASFSQAVSANLFSPIYTMFLNALKLIVAPLVFLSIASSISDFHDLRSLGRIAMKIVGGYSLTSVLAIALGAAVWFLFPIGNPALQAAVSGSAAANTVSVAQNTSVTLLDTVVGIIPSDIVTPFLQSNMLQVIFIAVLVGLATGALSDKVHGFASFLDECYQVFSRMTAMIIRVMPVAVFCSMARMILSMELSALSSVLAWVPVIYLGNFLMLGIYGVMIFLFGRQNPLIFYRKFFPVMLTAFTFASSNATLPTSMETCSKKLGISERLCSFSLPLGATINMNGSCITLIITSLFMTKIFGMPITGQMMLTLLLSIFVLSVGAPGVPGAALVCISILLPQIGIPAEAVSIIMGLYSIVAMIQVCVNVTGDAVITLLVGRSEKMLDEEVFRAK